MMLMLQDFFLDSNEPHHFQAGYHPVWAKQQADLFEKTKAGEYEFRSPDWDNVSASAKSLVRSMVGLFDKCLFL